ncbi:MAG: hypothetical protein ACYTFG_12400 [Planctomycetota bacterium]
MKIDTARPDYLVEYRIVEENERMEEVSEFDEALNEMIPILTEGATTRAFLRKLVLKLYFRITDGKTGPESTRVLYTDLLKGSAEDFIVPGDHNSARTQHLRERMESAKRAMAQENLPEVKAPRVHVCTWCKTANDLSDVPEGKDKARCYKCRRVFNLGGGN